nr:S1 RNA-binding domain-containing protein [bacterium]
MSDDKKRQDWDAAMDMTMEEFEQALDQSFAGDTLAAGDKVTGRVISMSETTVFLDIGGKSEGVVAIEEFLEDDGTLGIRPGDTVEVTVTHAGEEIRLSYRMRRRDQTLELLREAASSEIPVEGRVEASNKGGFDVRLGDYRAFCPISQIDIEYVENPAEHVGQVYHFLITRMERNGRDIVVSRSKLLQKEREALAQETLSRLAPGMITSGVVRRLMDFGAFVDIGGVEGLVHISHVSWDRLKHPSEVLEEGQSVRVKVLKMDPGNQRISLSIRDAQEPPWETHVGTDILEGNSYPGVVTRIEHFGAFVRLKPGLEGLLHISELSWTHRVTHPSEMLTIGDTIRVKVIQLDDENRRISLSMKQTDSDPWDRHRDSLLPGNTLPAEISRIKSAGLDVIIHSDLVGFVPASLSGIGQGERLQNTFHPGDTVQVRVVEADPGSHRLVLEIVDAQAEAIQQDVSRYLDDRTSRESGGFGNLGSALQKAIDRKKQRDQ